MWSVFKEPHDKRSESLVNWAYFVAQNQFACRESDESTERATTDHSESRGHSWKSVLPHARSHYSRGRPGVDAWGEFSEAACNAKAPSLLFSCRFAHERKRLAQLRHGRVHAARVPGGNGLLRGPQTFLCRL